MMIKVNRKIGLGSLSLALWIVGILFSVYFGDWLLEAIGLNTWSNIDTGIHYPFLYSYLFFIPAFILGYQNQEDFGAILGRRLSLFMIVWMGIMLLSF